MATNLGWEFYKGYFRNFTNEDYILSIKKEKTDNEKEYLKTKLNINSLFDTFDIIEDEMIGNIHFKATTTYPGLLLGSGYLHELHDVKGQLILGFDFDYTTGLPIIRGSSIKGVLRSAFKDNSSTNSSTKGVLRKKYIKEILQKEIDVKALELEIFGQENASNDTLAGKDVFFDAQIIKIQNTLLADDYLAPHKEITKDPIPLRFLKLAPNVTFRFDFELSDGIISKEQKRELFKTILEDLGVGAKTNVGYGKFYIPITKSDNPIENYKKPNQDLFKKLKELNLSNEKKKEYFEIFQKKFANEDKNGKWMKKITNLLMN